MGATETFLFNFKLFSRTSKKLYQHISATFMGNLSDRSRLVPATRPSLRSNQLRCRKIAAVAGDVASENRKSTYCGMRTNIEVRQDALLRSLAAPPVREKRFGCQKQRFAWNGFHPQRRLGQDRLE